MRFLKVFFIRVDEYHLQRRKEDKTINSWLTVGLSRVHSNLCLVS